MEREPSPAPPTTPDDASAPLASGRRLLNVLVFALAFLAIITATALIFRHEIATTLAREMLRHNGFDDAELSVTQFTFNKISAQRVTLPPLLRAKRIEVAFSWTGLAAGRLKSLVATGLHINLPKTNNASNDGDFPIEQVPIGHLRIDDGTAAFQTPQGPWEATFSVRLSLEERGARPLRVTMRALLDKNDVSLTLDGALVIAPTQTIDLKGSLKGRIGAGDLKAEFDGAIDALRLSTGRTWARLDLHNAAIDAGATKARLTQTIMQFNAAPDGGEFDLTGELHLQRANDPEWPDIAFAFGGDFPKTGDSAAANFHVHLDSDRLWGTLEGQLSNDHGLSGNFDLNGADAQYTAKALGVFKAAMDPAIPNGTIKLSSAGLWQDDDTIALLSGAISTGGQNPTDEVEFTANASINADWLASQTPTAAKSNGDILFQIEGALPLAPILANPENIDAVTLARAATVKGAIELALTSLSIPNAVNTDAVSGVVNFNLADETLHLHLSDSIQLDRTTVALNAAKPEVRGLLAGKIILYKTEKSLQFANLFSAPTVTFPPSLTLETPRASVRLLAPTVLEFNNTGDLQNATAPKTAFSAKPTLSSVGDAALRGEISNLHLTPTTASGAFRIHGAGQLDQGDLQTKLGGDVNGTFTKTGPRVSATLSTDSSLSLAQITIADTVSASTPLVLKPDQTAKISIDLSSGPPSLTYNLKLAPIRVTFDTVNATGATSIPLAFDSISMTGSTRGHQISLAQGKFAYPPQKIALDGVSLALDLAPDFEKATATLDIETIDQRTSAPWVSPMTMHAVVNLEGDSLVLNGRLDDKSGFARITASGAHNMANDTGGVTLKSGQIIFLPTVLQPEKLSPALQNIFREVDGDIDVTARFNWHDGVLSSDGEAVIAARKLVTNEYTVTDAATTITFDSLVPLSTPPEQVVDISVLDFGVPITDGRVILELKKDGSVRAGLEKFNLFGGRIETRPFTLPQDFNNFTIPLAVTGVQLDELLSIAKFGDLTATGALDGLLPLTIADGEVAVLGGLLETTNPGIIQYQPKGVGDALSDVNEGAALFLDIVKNFKYERIQVSLDETEFEQIALGFGIEGHNEAVYGGLPVKLNVNLSGPLRKILQQGYETFTTPAWLRERIQNIEQKYQKVKSAQP
jgi:hypothetical protein